MEARVDEDSERTRRASPGLTSKPRARPGEDATVRDGGPFRNARVDGPLPSPPLSARTFDPPTKDAPTRRAPPVAANRREEEPGRVSHARVLLAAFLEKHKR